MINYYLISFLLYGLVSLTYSVMDEFSLYFNTPKIDDKRYCGKPIPYTLEEFLDGSFLSMDFNGTWISASKILYRDPETEDLLIFDAKTLKSRVFLNSSLLVGSSSVSLSPDGLYLLVGQIVQHEFRMSNLMKYRVFDLRRKSWSSIAGNESVSFAIWSSVGNDLFYVLNNDIYYRQSLNNGTKVTRLTFNGVPGVIYNGVADWVYEEEVLKSSRALRVSPDGKYLIFATFNDTEVKNISYPIYGKPGEISSQYPVILNLKYPKAGSTNPTVALNLINLTNLHLSVTSLPAPIDIVDREHILYTFSWITNNTIAATWTNRVQNVAQITFYNLLGKPTNILTQRESEGWLTPSELTHYKGFLIFLSNQNSNTVDGKFRHITRIDLKKREEAKLEIDLTPGTSSVLAIVGIDESLHRIYYFASPPNAPSQRNLYSVSILNSTDPVCHSCSYKSDEGRPCTYADAKFSLDKSFYALTCHGPDPPSTAIYNGKGDQILIWEKNEILRTKLTHRLQPVIKDIAVTVNGYSSQAKLYLPSDFSEEKKYPMLVYVYGGPDSVKVVDAFFHGLAHYLTSNRSMIYAIVEGRGSGNKGSKMLFEIYRAFGTVEIKDIIDIIKYLQVSYSWIDANRTSIWGWSYGGYAAGMALATDVDSVFKCGISVAPVVSWIYYDSIYTERYMGLPTQEDNLAAYNRSDLTRLAEGIRGKDFILIHGTGDDNVHYQSSMQLAKTLIMNDIPFQEASYPDERHSFSGASSHLFHTIDNFLGKCLNLTYAQSSNVKKSFETCEVN